MLIINADDFGRSVIETDAALTCYRAGRITSASAMVFMADSERAAELVKENGLDIGLHLNFTERFTGAGVPSKLLRCHARVARFLTRNKCAQLLYNPFLRVDFSICYDAQAAEFMRLFERPPSHIDGHHHMHLCANLVLSGLVPPGTKMRRNFSFWPGEKSFLNRRYRALVDFWLARKHRLADYFFDLTQSIREKKLERVAALARSRNVELMTHPVSAWESEYLLSDGFREILQRAPLGVYSVL